jgi:hypothetical protein
MKMYNLKPFPKYFFVYAPGSAKDLMFDKFKNESIFGLRELIPVKIALLKIFY